MKFLLQNFMNFVKSSCFQRKIIEIFIFTFKISVKGVLNILLQQLKTLANYRFYRCNVLLIFSWWPFFYITNNCFSSKYIPSVNSLTFLLWRVLVLLNKAFAKKICAFEQGQNDAYPYELKMNMSYVNGLR